MSRLFSVKRGAAAWPTPTMKPRLVLRSLVIFLAVSALALAACGAEDTPTPPPTAGPTQSAPTSTPIPTAEPTKPAPTPTPDPTPTPAKPIELSVIAPLDGAGIEVGAAKVMGHTSGTAVSVNGATVPIQPDGSFERDLPLQNGVNLIDVTALDASGRSTSQQLVVFFVSPTSGLPFTLLYPRDGLEISQPQVSIVGVTTPDAVIGVNEEPVEVNGLGIFSEEVPLVPGDNLIEVVATDILGNVRFQTVVVFYEP